MIHILQILHDPWVLSEIAPHVEVFPYGEVAEDVPSFQTLGKAKFSYLMRLFAVNPLSHEPYFTAGNFTKQPCDGAEHGGFSCAVSADEGDDLVAVHFKIYPF